MTRDEADAFGDRELLAVAPTLLATAPYLARSDADAADLVQATLEIALRRRAQLRDPARLRSWLLAIETREAFRLRRRLRAHVSLGPGGPDGGWVLLSVSAGPCDLVTRDQPHEDLRWVWAITFVTADGLEYTTTFLDYADGTPIRLAAGSVDGLGPNP